MKENNFFVAFHIAALISRGRKNILFVTKSRLPSLSNTRTSAKFSNLPAYSNPPTAYHFLKHLPIPPPTLPRSESKGVLSLYPRENYHFLQPDLFLTNAKCKINAYAK